MVYSLSPFANAVAFTTVTPTVTAFTVTPNTPTMNPGESLQIMTGVVGTGCPTNKAIYEMSGNSSPDSFVTPLGKVVLSKYEEGPEIIVKCTSVQAPEQSANVTITVNA